MSRRSSHGREPTEDVGAALVLALVFLVGLGPILLALASLADTNLLNTSNIQTQRNIEFAADADVDAAVQALRFQTPGSSCPTFTSPPGGVNNVALTVQCEMSIPLNTYGRLVEFDACAPAVPSFGTCQQAAVLQAEILYNDVSNAPGCTGSPLPAGCYGNSWGTSLTVLSWKVITASH